MEEEPDHRHDIHLNARQVVFRTHLQRVSISLHSFAVYVSMNAQAYGRTHRQYFLFLFSISASRHRHTYKLGPHDDCNVTREICMPVLLETAVVKLNKRGVDSLL